MKRMKGLTRVERVKRQMKTNEEKQVKKDDHTSLVAASELSYGRLLTGIKRHQVCRWQAWSTRWTKGISFRCGGSQVSFLYPS